MELAEILKRSDLFCRLSPEVICREILPHMKLQDFPRGKYLIHPQDRMDKFGLILSGRLHIIHLFADGGSSLSIVLEPPEFLGTDLICTRSRKSPYSVVSATPCRIAFFPGDLVTVPGQLEESCRLEILNCLLRHISDKNIKKEYRIAILSQKGLRERILTYLTMQTGKRGSPTVVIPFSREEMASFLCVNRSALSHELSLMQQEGLISFHKNVFTLRSREQT